MSFRNMGLNWSQVLGIAIPSILRFDPNPSVAQITPDGTLANNSSVTSEGNGRIITGGTQKVGNLFHSFRDFSVPNNVNTVGLGRKQSKSISFLAKDLL